MRLALGGVGDSVDSMFNAAVQNGRRHGIGFLELQVNMLVAERERAARQSGVFERTADQRTKKYNTMIIAVRAAMKELDGSSYAAQRYLAVAKRYEKTA